MFPTDPSEKKRKRVRVDDPARLSSPTQRSTNPAYANLVPGDQVWLVYCILRLIRFQSCPYSLLQMRRRPLCHPDELLLLLAEWWVRQIAANSPIRFFSSHSISKKSLVILCGEGLALFTTNFLLRTLEDLGSLCRNRETFS